MQGETHEHLLAFWRNALKDAPTIFEITGDRARPETLTFRGNRIRFEFDEALSNGIRDLARRENATLFMTLLAGFETLLYRYSGCADFLIGTDVANRGQKEVEGLIGFFLNHVVLRADLSGDPTFSELVGRVRKNALDAFAHEELSFDKVVEEINPERRSENSPLFQVLFVLQNAEGAALKLPAIEAEHVKVEQETCKYDLVIFLRETNDRIVGSLLYQTDLFDSTRMERMAKHYETMLRAIVESPNRPISAYPMLLEEETGGVSARQFSKAGMSQKDFETLLQRMGNTGKRTQ